MRRANGVKNAASEDNSCLFFCKGHVEMPALQWSDKDMKKTIILHTPEAESCADTRSWSGPRLIHLKLVQPDNRKRISCAISEAD